MPFIKYLYTKQDSPTSHYSSYWQNYLETCEDSRHQIGMKQRYQTRKESIERVFGSAKEYHNMRYTREKGKSKMEAKVGLTFACLN